MRGIGDADGDAEEAECWCCDAAAAADPTLDDAAVVRRDEPGPDPDPEPGAEAADGERERNDMDEEADKGAASKSPLNARRKRAISERSSSFSLQCRIGFRGIDDKER